jgi:hypothetical protein
MNTILTLLLFVSIGIAFLALMVVATTYTRPEQSGLSVHNLKDRYDLFWIVGGASGLIVLNFSTMLSNSSNEFRIGVVALNVVVQVLVIWLLVSSWRHAYKRFKG